VIPSALKKTTSLSLLVVVLIGLYLLVTSAFFPLGFLSTLDAKRLLQLMLFAVLTIFAVSWAPLRQSTIAQLGRLSLSNGVILGFFFLIGIASSLRLDHPGYALVDVSMIFVMMMLIAVTAASREIAGVSFDRWAVVLLAAMGFAVTIQEFMGFIVGWVAGFEFNYNMAFIHFAHPRFYNQLQTWSIPVLAALPLLFPGKRWIKFTCITLLGLQWFLVIAFAARGTVVSLFAAMVFVALWLPEQRRFWLKYQLMGLLTGIVIYAAVLFMNSVLIPQSQSGNFYAYSAGRSMVHTSGRSTLWRLAKDDAIKNPFLGAGPTRYACDSEKIIPAHPHSFPLRILGEWGLVALLLIFLLAVRIGIGFLKHLRNSQKVGQTDPPLRAMLAISLIAGVIHACVSGLLIMPASQVATILIAGWALSLSGNTPYQPVATSLTRSLPVASIFITCAMLVFAIGELTQLSVRTSYSVEYGPMMPRFWQDGRVCEYIYRNP
jgi:putative inorganic carbon (HCO3(-)) transporter